MDGLDLARDDHLAFGIVVGRNDHAGVRRDLGADPGHLVTGQAEDLFAEKGFSATSLGEVADRVGIRSPSLYNHFRNKEALYTAVLERLLDDFTGPMEDLNTGPITQERVMAWLETRYVRLLSFNLDHRWLTPVIGIAINRSEGGPTPDDGMPGSGAGGSRTCPGSTLRRTRP